MPGDSDDVLTPDISHPAAGAITFRLLTESDLPLIHAWLNNPEVARFYGLDPRKPESADAGPGRQAPRIRGERPIFCYVIMSGQQPAGFIQTYRVGDYPDYARAIDYDDDAWAIDLFIGEDDRRGGGFGSRALVRFLESEVFTRPGLEVGSHFAEPGQQASDPGLREGRLPPPEDCLGALGEGGGIRDGAPQSPTAR